MVSHALSPGRSLSWAFFSTKMRIWWNPSDNSWVKIEKSQVDFKPNRGVWTLLTPRSGIEGFECSIITVGDPLLALSGPYASLVVPKLNRCILKWLYSAAKSSINISQGYRLTNTRIDVPGALWTYDQFLMTSLRTHFEYLMPISRAHTSFLNGEHHFKWISDPADVYPDSPEYLINNALADSSGDDVKALHRLLRFPTRFEGGTDFIFERQVSVALRLLFDADDILTVNLCQTNEPPHPTEHPPAVDTNSFEWDTNAKYTFAACAHATLARLVRNSHEEHCIVYGLHCSRDKLRIIAHFPLDVSDSAVENWKFAQVMVAEHWIGLARANADFPLFDDNALLHRWRLAGALFFVRKHVMSLRELLGYASNTQDTLPNSSGAKDSSDSSLSSFRSSEAQTLRAPLLHWRSVTISVPQSWILPEQVMHQPPVIEAGADVVRSMLHILPRLILHPIRELLKPIENEEVQNNSLSSEYQGPDFAHSVQIPRSHYQDRSAGDSNASTEASLLRCYDFLTMATHSWKEINIFIAGVFSNVAGYSVLWHPLANYSTAPEQKYEDIDCVYDDIVMDFALSIGAGSASIPLTIKRTPSLPLTFCNPAALLGLRTIHMEDDGNIISELELSKLKGLAADHFRPISSALHLEDSGGVLPEWATVMGTFLKRGFIHLIAFRCLGGDKTPLVSVEIIDSLPIQCSIKDSSELAGRMRLFIALLTLQRHTAQFASQWNNIPMDGALMESVHSIIVGLTGISTPTVSDDSDED